MPNLAVEGGLGSGSPCLSEGEGVLVSALPWASAQFWKQWLFLQFGKKTQRLFHPE